MRATPAGSRDPDGIRRRCRPAGATADGNRGDHGVRAGIDSNHSGGPGRPDRSERPHDSRREGQRPAADDAVPCGIDALELSLAVGRRPGGAGGERRVVGGAADRDRLQALSGRDRHAADRGRARVLHPHRACAIAEAAGAEADVGLPDDPARFRVDANEVGRSVFAHPDEASPGGRRARRCGDGERDLGDDGRGDGDRRCRGEESEENAHVSKIVRIRSKYYDPVLNVG